MTEAGIPTDEQTRVTVLSALSANEQTATLNLRVGVMNGVVHLGGSVPSLSLRQLAEDITAQAPGIRGVVNRIEAPGAPPPGRIIHLDSAAQEPSQEIPSPGSE
jgi:osmotically-inducible protein OsmY